MRLFQKPHLKTRAQPLHEGWRGSNYSKRKAQLSTPRPLPPSSLPFSPSSRQRMSLGWKAMKASQYPLPPLVHTSKHVYLLRRIRKQLLSLLTHKNISGRCNLSFYERMASIPIQPALRRTFHMALSTLIYKLGVEVWHCVSPLSFLHWRQTPP